MKKSIFLVGVVLIIGIFSCEKQIDYQPQINILNSNISALQKSRDSLAAALAQTNNNLNATNNNVAALSKSLDSIKVQLTSIGTQIATLNSQMASANANIATLTAQIAALNLQYIDLLAKYNAIILQLTQINLNTGLVAYYPFNGNANDFSSNGYNGTVFGASLISDRNNNANSAYSFTKTSENYIALPLLTPINGATVASFSFWVKTNSVSNSGTIFGHWSNNNGGVGVNCGISIEQQSTTTGIGIYNYSGTGGIFTPSISVNKWHHVVINIDFSQSSNASKVITFIDNSVQSLTFEQFNNSIGNATSTFIGRRNSDFGTYGVYFDGAIDDFRIFNRNLTSSEISYLYNH
jgi:cell division protein FtsB